LILTTTAILSQVSDQPIHRREIDRVDDSTPLPTRCEQAGMTELSEMKGQSRVRECQFLRDHSCPDPIWARLNKVSKNREPRFLSKTGKYGNGIIYFHISNNIEIMYEVKLFLILNFQ
jgi:hypothetical protein